MKLSIIIISLFIFILNANSQTIEKVEAKNAFEIIQNRDTTNTIIIDGRSDKMYSEKHIEGSINIDAFEDLLTIKLKNYLEAEKIIVYCSNYTRSELIIEELKEIHYKGYIVFIQDGINAWISSGFKTIN